MNIIWVFGLLVCGLLGAVVGSRKGATVSSFIVSVLLGPLGVLIAVISRGNRRPCPHCKESIVIGATICPHCRTPLGQASPAGAPQPASVSASTSVAATMTSSKPDNTKTAMQVVLVLCGILGVVIVVVLASRARTESADVPATRNDVPTTPAAPLDPLARCAGCSDPPATLWSFNGLYADAKCTQPIVSAVPVACQVVPALGDATVSTNEPFAKRPGNGEGWHMNVQKQLSSDDLGHIYRRQAGKTCASYSGEQSGKITPIDCAGKRVCRDVTGQLACGACKTLPNGCPAFDATKIFATAQPLE